VFYGFSPPLVLAVLHAIPSAWYSSKFEITRCGRELGLLKPSWWSERATFSVKDVEFEMYRESLMGDFVLAFEGAVLARADKPSAFERRFVLTVEERRYVLESESAFRRAFRLRATDGETGDGDVEPGEVVGRIAPEGALTRDTTVDLPEALPLPVQAFCFWLVLVLWNRAAGAAASG
jgi:hypothetical protein